MDRYNKFKNNEIAGRPEGAKSTRNVRGYAPLSQVLKLGQAAAAGTLDAALGLKRADGETLNLSPSDLIPYISDHLQRIDLIINELKVEKSVLSRLLTAVSYTPSELKRDNLPVVLQYAASARTADGRALIRSKGEWFYVLKVLAEHGYIESTDYKGFIDLFTRANVPEDIFPSKQNLYGMGAGFGNDKNRFPNWKKPEEMRRSTFIHAVEIGEWVEKRLKV